MPIKQHQPAEHWVSEDPAHVRQHKITTPCYNECARHPSRHLQRRCRACQAAAQHQKVPLHTDILHTLNSEDDRALLSTLTTFGWLKDSSSWISLVTAAAADVSCSITFTAICCRAQRALQQQWRHNAHQVISKEVVGACNGSSRL
jgi:hypothetical protein